MNLRVAIGDTVTWINNDSVQHSVTGGSGVSRYEGYHWQVRYSRRDI
ncbi:MAG: hypothetical protein NZ888_05045 [Candidatus Nitrosocaldus sp.]|nr:hypothetical protein [Candidatus Nitrosocaldus sp.]MDW8000347.1 hypothetical protein [Candidatus Nitrosocaldus sp.]